MEKIHHGIFPGSTELEMRGAGENLFYGLYFIMTGLHGLHVLIGIIIFIFLLYFLLDEPYKTVILEPHQLSMIGEGRLQIADENQEKLWEGSKIDRSVSSVSIKINYEDSKLRDLNGNIVRKMENGGLYWHLVDIIWIFLFPLFYIIS